MATLWVADVPAQPGLTAVNVRSRRARQSRPCGLPSTNPCSPCPTRPLFAEPWNRSNWSSFKHLALLPPAPYADILLPATTWGEKTAR